MSFGVVQDKVEKIKVSKKKHYFWSVSTLQKYITTDFKFYMGLVNAKRVKETEFGVPTVR